MPKNNSEEEKTSTTDESNEDGPEESKEKKSTETQFHDNEIHTSTTTLAVNYLRPEELEISGYPKVCDTRLCFNRLQAGRINLNLPPDNWLRSNPFENLDGFNAKNYLENKFSSLRMAYDFSNLEPPVDVITAAKNIKKLLKLAITSGDGLSMFVHPIGSTLLIDDFDIHKWLMTPDPQWKWLKDFFFRKVLENKSNRSDINRAIVRKSHSHDAVTERNLMSKFLHYSLPHESARYENKPLVYHQSESPVKISTTAKSPTISLPEASGEFGNLEAHARTLLWNIEDIRMLIGSDMPIFGDKDHPSISLRLHDMQKSINVLTGLDYWLDNLMCQVPEVLMCFHQDGIVQKYELIKTEDLPKLNKDAMFDETSVMKVAKNILAFLKQNATKEGHTYWLFKAKDEDIVKLYDLTSLCNDQNASSAEEDENSEQKKAPFKDEVSILLYKIARNVVHNRKTSGDEAATARRILENCLNLLDRKKYPQIAASASYLLADIYIPEELDPLNPNLDNSESKAGNLNPENLDNISKSAKKRKKKKDKKNKNKGENSKNEVINEPNYQETKTPEVSVDDLRNQEEPPEPPLPTIEPLPDLEKRCYKSLDHICESFHITKYLDTKKHEMEEKQRKAQEQHERDNPKMGKPMEAIPMPYKTNGGRLKLYKSQVGPMDKNWTIDLKAVLLRKAFLVFITFSEMKFKSNDFGSSVKAIKRALNCFYAIVQLGPGNPGGNVKMLLALAYGIAGDCYMKLFELWESHYVKFVEDFNDLDLDLDFDLELEESNREWVLKVPSTMEEDLFLALKCLRSAMDLYSDDEDEVLEEARTSMASRYANSLNCTASLYIKKSTSMLDSDFAISDVEELLNSAIHMLEEAIELFKSIKNVPNIVIVTTNLAMCYRTHAVAIKLDSSRKLDENSKSHNIYHPVSKTEEELIYKAQSNYNEAYASVRFTEFKEMTQNTAFNSSHFLQASINEIWVRSLENSIGTDGKPKSLRDFKLPFDSLVLVENLFNLNKNIIFENPGPDAASDEKIANMYNKRTTDLCTDVILYSWKYFSVMLNSSMVPEIVHYTKYSCLVAEYCMNLHNLQDMFQLYFRAFFIYHFYSLTLVRITRDINDINVKPNESDVYVETFIALLDSMNNEFGKFSIGSILKKPITTRHLEDYLQKDYTKMEKEEKSPIVDDIKKITNYMTQILTDREKVNVEESKAVRDLNDLDHPLPIGGCLFMIVYVIRELKTIFEILAKENPGEDYTERIKWCKDNFMEIYGIKWEMPDAWLKLKLAVRNMCLNAKRVFKCNNLHNCDFSELTKTIEALYIGVEHLIRPGARGATESEKVKMNEEIFKDIIKEDLKRNTTLTGTKIQEILEKKNPEIPINLVKNKVPKTKFMKTSRK